MTTPSLESRLEHALGCVVAWSLRHSVAILVATVGLTIGCGFHVVNNLGINTDTADMLSPKLEWRRTYLDYQTAFPQFVDTIAVVVDGTTPGRAEDAAAALAARLSARPDLFEDVVNGQDDPHFQRNQLLYLDLAELATLADRLSGAQPFLASLAADPSLRGLFDLLNSAVTELRASEGLPIEPTLARIDTTIRSVLQDRPEGLSWQELMTGTTATKEDRRRVIMVKPIIDFSEMLPGAAAMRGITDEINALPPELQRDVVIRRTGGAALGYEELKSVSQGSAQAAVIAFVLITVCLVIGLGSLSLVIATQLILLVGLILTAAFATVAIGELNLISVAFAALYLGLASAFSIHYALRVRELLAHGDKQRALVDAAGHVGSSMVLCALATALGFYSFIPTAYRGVAELGLIAGTGMIISFVLSITVLPAMMHHLPFRSRIVVNRGVILSRVANWPIHHARTVAVATAIVALASCLLIPQARFNQNPIHLQDPTTESVQTFRDLLEESSRSPYSITIVADDAAAAVALRAALERLPTVDSVQSIDSFVPDDQANKLMILEDLALTFGTSLRAPADWSPPDLAEQLKALGALIEALAEPARTMPAAAAALREDLLRLKDRVDADQAGAASLLATTEHALLGELPARIERLGMSLAAQAFARDELPESIRQRWVAADGRPRLEVFPKEDLDDNDALKRFVTEVQSVAGAAATDTPVVIVEAGKAVVLAFQQALTLAILTIALLLWYLLRDLREVLLSIGPLLLAGLTTCALLILLGQSFNFANIIALPLLLGIGVDNALHIMHRYRTDLPRDGLVLTTSTARAVLFDGLTAIAGFGNLALSRHLGTASMGVMLAVGLAIMVLYSLLILPSFLTLLPLKRNT